MSAPPPAPASATSAARNWPLRFLIGVGLLAAAAAAPVAIRASHRADFERYYTAARAALRSEDIYALRDDRQFKYLPAFALLLAPLALVCETVLPADQGESLPTEAQLLLAASIWYCLAVLAYGSTLWLAIGLGADRARGWQPWLLLIAFAFSARFLWDNLRLGQVNIFAMFFTCLAIALIYRQRPAAAGICA
ncbi:MAG: DUF2029 domain-containing protein, partial [Planctomycetota bacterium]|nr:DUF2029 domain-containing protein [Planctomycetota bacterium]